MIVKTRGDETKFAIDFKIARIAIKLFILCICACVYKYKEKFLILEK